MKYADVFAIEADAKAKWSRDADLRKEFLGDFNLYFAYRKASARGATPVPKKGTSAHAAPRGGNVSASQDQIERDARAHWDGDPNIRAEFLSLDSFVAFKRAEGRGVIRIVGKAKPPSTEIPSPAPAQVAAMPEQPPSLISPPTTAAKSPAAKELSSAGIKALADFKRDFPAIADALIAEDRALGK